MTRNLKVKVDLAVTGLAPSPAAALRPGKLEGPPGQVEVRCESAQLQVDSELEDAGPSLAAR